MSSDALRTEGDPPARGDEIVVLGAGLTGLSASLHLLEAGISHRLVERSTSIGGHASTIEESGYRFDRTGHLLHLRNLGMRTLVRSLLEPGSFVEVTRRSAVYSNGVYTRYPFQANTFGLPKEIAYECVMGFVEAQLQRARTEGSVDESAPRTFEDYCLQHFGRGISRHFMVPYNTKLWGVHPREITAAWCERFVPIPKLEDVIAGSLGINDRELGYNTHFLYPRLGIGELVRALGGRAARAETGRSPKAIHAEERRIVWEDGAQTFGDLISTIPLPDLVSLIVDAPDRVREAAAELRTTSLYYLDVALNTPCEKNYHWVYVPEPKLPFYRVGCYSNFSAAMAPTGKAGLYVELSDRTEPDLRELLPRVADALTEMGFIRAREAIRFARLRHIQNAYVVFDVHHEKAMATIQRFLASVEIQSVGRYGGFNYSSMEDALLFGRDAARLVIDRRI